MMEQSLVDNSLDNDVYVDQWTLTHTKEMKFHYTWTIDNFNNCVEKCGECKDSPCFSGGTDDDSKWSLRVYPKGRNKNNSGFVALFLRLDSCKKDEVIASYVFSTIDKEFKQTRVRKAKPKPFNQGTGNGYIKYIKIGDEIESLLTEDKLMICCEVSVKEDTINVSGQGDLVQVKVPRGCVSDDFGKLFEEMKLSDVTLVAGGGKEIRAHKLVLAARSEVFAAMFEHDMQEQKLSRVDITDLDHEVLTEMLRFMYTDCTPNLDKMAADLLLAADKYGLDNLKLLCEEALYWNLSVETAADTLVLADLHSVDRLKKQTISFINSRHVALVMATEGWKKMAFTCPHLIAELFSNITDQVQQHLPIYKFTSCKTSLRSDAVRLFC